MNGLKNIADVFSQSRAESRAALMPYFTLGYPTPAISIDVVEAISKAGAELIELGVPFSDPLADGPTIQHSTQIALENDITVKACLGMVKDLRRRGIKQPLLLMGYFNPILAFGEEKFVSEACSAGADGLIVPDLPFEESAILEADCQKYKLALIYLVAPTTPDDRLAEIVMRSTGFVYIVSLMGVTGARSRLPANLHDFLQRVRNVTDKPIAVGFGISTPEQVASVGKLAEGVIVGSALIDIVGKARDPTSEAAAFIFDLAKSLR